MRKFGATPKAARSSRKRCRLEDDSLWEALSTYRRPAGKVCYLSPLCLPYPAQLRPLPQRGRSDSSRSAEGASPHLAAGRPRRASSCRSPPTPPPRLFPLRRSREGGDGDGSGGGGGGCPARPVGVTGRRALRSVGASSSRAEPSGGRGRSPRGRRRAAAAAAAARARARASIANEEGSKAAGV